MTINVSEQYNGGFPPDIMLLAHEVVYLRGTHFKIL